MIFLFMNLWMFEYILDSLLSPSTRCMRVWEVYKSYVFRVKEVTLLRYGVVTLSCGYNGNLSTDKTTLLYRTHMVLYLWLTRSILKAIFTKTWRVYQTYNVTVSKGSQMPRYYKQMKNTHARLTRCVLLHPAFKIYSCIYGESWRRWNQVM